MIYSQNTQKMLASLYDRRLDIIDDIVRAEENLEEHHSELQSVESAIVNLEAEVE